MTLTITLSDERAAALQAKAAAEGLSLEDWIQRLAGEESAAGRPRQHIAELILENMQDVPADHHFGQEGLRALFRES